MPWISHPLMVRSWPRVCENYVNTVASRDNNTSLIGIGGCAGRSSHFQRYTPLIWDRVSAKRVFTHPRPVCDRREAIFRRFERPLLASASPDGVR